MRNKTKKQLLIVGITVLLVCIGLSGCTDTNNSVDNNEYSFVGTWLGETIKSEKLVEQTITYFSNGTFSNDIFGNGTYEINNSKLVMAYYGTGNITYDYSFSDDGNTLTLTKTGTINSEVLTKQ